MAEVDADAMFEMRAAKYERITGGCVQDVARYFLGICAPINEESVILDNGSGPCVVTGEIMHMTSTKLPPKAIHAVDKAPSTIQYGGYKVKANGWGQIVTTEVMDAQELSFPDNTFTHSFSNFVLFFCPDAGKAARHIYRTLQPGGTAVVTTWQAIGWESSLRQAQLEVRPDLIPVRPPFAPDWYAPEHLEKTLRDAGFEKISMTQKETAMRGKSLDEVAGFIGELFAHATDHWEESEKIKFVPNLRGSLEVNDALKIDADGAAVRMVANVALAFK